MMQQINMYFSNSSVVEVVFKFDLIRLVIQISLEFVACEKR